MKIPCTIMRGGTSKAIVVREADLPGEVIARDQVILQLFGSPDRRQIDGLGGADPLTSKLAIIGPPSRKDADIDYTFGQVLIDQTEVDYTGNCGNITAGVAAFAVGEGYATLCDGVAEVRIHCTNSGRIVTAQVPVDDSGQVIEDGDAAIAGVPGTGAPIVLDFADTAGAGTGSVLPLGRCAKLSGCGGIRISVVDVGNPMIFVDRADFAVDTGDGPDELDGSHDLLKRLGEIRVAAMGALGLTGADGRLSSSIPLITLVGGPAPYRRFDTGESVAAPDMDVWARSIFVNRTHKAFGAAEAASIAAAAVIPGTLVHDCTRRGAHARGCVRIGHPSGVLGVGIEARDLEETPVISRVSVLRTARRLLDGQAYVRPVGCHEI